MQTRWRYAACGAALFFAGLLAVGTSRADTLRGLVITLDYDNRGRVEAITRDYALELVERWHSQALSLDCLVMRAADAAAARSAWREMSTDPRIESVQLERHHRVAGAVPTMPVKDPYFDLQMRTQRRDVAPLLQRAAGRGVRVAVLDTGVDMSHPDLKSRITEAINFVSGDPALIPAEFHGTAVVGLIAARAGNGIGIHGLAPEAEIFALRACWEPTYAIGLCSTNTLAQALDYAIDIRARIINLSLAGPDDPLLTRLVARAIELGAVVFGAAGEEPGQTFPASVAEVVAVAQGEAAVPIAGAQLSIPGLQILTTVPEGRYDFLSGPSFATAHASGVAAVMLELQPHLSASQLVAWMHRLHGSGPAAAQSYSK